MLKLLAFDYGAGSGRAIMGKFDGEKLTLSEAHRFANDPVTVNGNTYWDVLRLFHEMKQGIGKCVQNGDADLSGIGVDTWGVDFGLLDSNGDLLGNPVHYRDPRTEGMIGLAAGRVSKKEIYNTTGIAFQKFNTLYQLLAMKETNSPLLEKAGAMLFMPDLFNFFLSGELASEYTIASTSQMVSAAARDWAWVMLDRIGIPIGILQKLIEPGTVLGKLRRELAAELNVPVVPVIAVAEHDTGSAVLSVPAAAERFAYLSSGTWSLLGTETKAPVINETTYNLNYTNEGGINQTVRVLKNIMGLWILQECKREWDRGAAKLGYQELEKMAEQAEAFGSLIDPDHPVFYSPGTMPAKITGYCRNTDQKIPDSQGAMVRCILESLAFKYRMALEGLETAVGYPFDVIHIVGGGSQNTMLNQFTANAIGKPVITGPVEATAIGNLLAQLMALGEIGNLEQARRLVKKSVSVEEYTPRETEKWNEVYQRFTKLVEESE